MKKSQSARFRCTVSTAFSVWWLASCSQTSGNVQIARNLEFFKLDSTIDEVVRIARIQEDEDSVLALEKKFLEPDKVKELAAMNQRLILKTYKVLEPLPEGAASASLKFCGGHLYQIGFHYKRDYVDKVDWDTFSAPFTEKYGNVRLENSIGPSAGSFNWTDGKTRLSIAKGEAYRNGKVRRETDYYNAHLTDIATNDSISSYRKAIQSDPEDEE